MRAVLALLFAVGCAPASGDFIEVHGSFPDGTRIDVHASAITNANNGAQPQLSNATALSAPLTGPENLTSVRLEWLPGSIVVGKAEPSMPGGPYIFYIGSPIPDAGVFSSQLSVVNGGAITFTENDAHARGTLSSLILMRNGTTLVTIDSGTFSATNP